MKEPRTYKNKKGETEVTLAFTEKKEDELCDFCSSLKPPYKEYPCRDFQHPLSPLHWSRGEWNACDKCAALVDAGDREGLLQRSLMMASFEHELSAEAEIMTRAFQNAFFANRIKRQPVSAHPEPKSGQPESPGSPASFHNQGGGFPDEDLSK